MTRVSTNIRLVEAYKKQPVRVTLAPREDMGQLASREMILTPVLYHGTARARILEWQQERGISVLNFSLACSWHAAGLYATYKVARILQDSVYLQNKIARQIITSGERLRQTGYCGNSVTNSIAFFDRDSLLKLPESQFEMQAEETHGFCLKRESKSAVIPFNSLIAAISFLPGHSPYLEVFSRELWDANFSVPPPPLEGMPAWTSAEPFPVEILKRVLGN